MIKSKKFKVVLSVALALVLTFALWQLALAAEIFDFPLLALNGDLVADQNTLFVTEISQDPVTKFITASVSVTNGSSGATAKNLVISGVSIELSFDSRISPYRYNPVTDGNNHPYDATRLYSGGLNINDAEFKKYSFAPTVGFQTMGSCAIQNSGSNRLMGVSVSSANTNDILHIAPGAKVTIAQMYFMPTNGQDLLDLNMFLFEYRNQSTTPGLLATRLANWIGNGKSFLYGDRRSMNSGETYLVNKQITVNGQAGVSQSFRLHMTQAPPAVTANEDDPGDRFINGYNETTMRWSYNETSGYQSGKPVVLDEACVIYVIKLGTNYSGSDAVYGDYKKFLDSPPTKVEFSDADISCANDVSLTKASTNLTVHPDGRIHAGDTIEYTIIAKNDGHALSVWADAVMTDIIPAFLTFADNVKLNGTALTAGQYTYNAGSKTLTVPLGNIQGKTQKTVTFEVTINNDAHGQTIINEVKVKGTDGIGGLDLELTAQDKNATGTGIIIVARSAKPVINDITVGDAEVSGSGVTGATIVVTFPGGATQTVTVVAGAWKVDVPAGVTLVKDNVVTAIQTEPTKDPSEAAEAIVGGRPEPVKQAAKSAVNLANRADGSWRVGDIIEYTITATNAGPAKSLWVDVPVIDTLPNDSGVRLVDYVPNSATIDGLPAGTAATYDDIAGVLTVMLGDIPGGVTKTVVFRAVLNENSYGKIAQNTAKVDDLIVIPPIIPPRIIDRTPVPVIDEVNEGDRYITGTGVAGAAIVVTFPNTSLKGNATVGVDGKWSATVPVSINLVEGQVISAVQTVPTWDPSAAVEATVMGKTHVVPFVKKTRENLSRNDGTTHVGDKIKFTITVRNDGPKSTWSDVVVTDEIPAGLTYVNNSVRLDGKTPTYSSYIPSTLQVTIIPTTMLYGVEHFVTFEVTVDGTAAGSSILNIAVITGKDSNGDPTEDEAEDEGGIIQVTGISADPTINKVTRDDAVITGTGVAGAAITVTLKDGTELTGTVDALGNWTVDVPGTKLPQTGDIIKAVQKEPGKDFSGIVQTTVVDKSYRAVHGFVFPLVSTTLEDLGGIPEFPNMHAITVELRATYQTPAAAGLSVKAVAKGVDGLGEFTIPNVPFGNYILVISRPGYLSRPLAVTISASSPDLIELTPPGTADKGVFNLWAGDCNNDFVIESKDMMMLLELMDMTVSVFDAIYNPACDLNADGAIESKDIMIILEMWGKMVWDYAGAENIDVYQ